LATVIAIVHLASNHNRNRAMKENIEIIARATADEPDVVSITEIGGGAYVNT